MLPTKFFVNFPYCSYSGSERVFRMATVDSTVANSFDSALPTRPELCSLSFFHFHFLFNPIVTMEGNNFCQDHAKIHTFAELAESITRVQTTKIWHVILLHVLMVSYLAYYRKKHAIQNHAYIKYNFII